MDIIQAGTGGVGTRLGAGAGAGIITAGIGAGAIIIRVDLGAAVVGTINDHFAGELTRWRAGS